MLKFIAGLVVGAVFGFLAAAMSRASKDHYKTKKNDKNYKCKNNALNACGDQCCYFCLGASDCMWACEQNPGKCGQSVVR